MEEEKNKKVKSYASPFCNILYSRLLYFVFFVELLIAVVIVISDLNTLNLPVILQEVYSIFFISTMLSVMVFTAFAYGFDKSFIFSLMFSLVVGGVILYLNPLKVMLARNVTIYTFAFFCIVLLLYRARKGQGDLLAVFGILLFPLFVFNKHLFIKLISAVTEKTYDAALLSADQLLGINFYQISDVVVSNELFLSIAVLFYCVLPVFISPIYVRALKENKDNYSFIIALINASIIGYFIYGLYPACGPKFAFEGFVSEDFFNVKFPTYFSLSDTSSMLIPVDIEHRRNCMPSLHFSWAFLMYLHSRSFGIKYTMFYAFFLVVTFIALFAFKEHYFMDVVVAFPFVTFIQSISLPFEQFRTPVRMRALFISLFLLSLWIFYLSVGITMINMTPSVLGILVVATIGVSVKLERDLYGKEQILYSTAEIKIDK